MSSKVQKSVCSDCETYAKSRIKFNTLNTFNNVERKVGYMDYMRLKPGETRVFYLDTVKACYNGRVLAYTTPKKHPRKDVKRYKATVDEDERTLTVHAVSFAEDDKHYDDFGI